MKAVNFTYILLTILLTITINQDNIFELDYMLRIRKQNLDQKVLKSKHC